METANESTGGNTKSSESGTVVGASGLSKQVLRTKDFMVSGEEFALIQVDENGLLRTHPVPANLSAYYQSEAYISHTDRRKTLFEKLYQGFKVVNLKSKIKLLHRLHDTKGRLLDFGSGTGDFLYAAQKAGWEIWGVEPEDGARARGNQKGVRAGANLEWVPEVSFDIITLWHVLEHLPEPGRIIRALGVRLSDKGHLIIAVPNYQSFDGKYYRSYWAAYDTPRHLWHFTRPSLVDLLKSQGFELVKERPMWFDAYYVSWLSEKYRQNPWAPIRAFLIASISNLLAVFSGESSSRIYVFRKSGNKA